MMVFRYPPRTLVGDYLRSLAGLGVGVGVLSAASPGLIIAVVFGGVCLLFGAFGYRTVQRHITRVAVNDEGICTAAFRTRAITWSDLERVRLRYYGTRRDRDGRGGFMQLTLTGGGTSCAYESSLTGFKYVAWRAAKALRDNEYSMDPASAGNLLAIGLDADGETPPPEPGEPSP